MPKKRTLAFVFAVSVLLGFLLFGDIKGSDPALKIKSHLESSTEYDLPPSVDQVATVKPPPPPPISEPEEKVTPMPSSQEAEAMSPLTSTASDGSKAVSTLIPSPREETPKTPAPVVVVAPTPEPLAAPTPYIPPSKYYYHDAGRMTCTPIPKKLHFVWLDICWPDTNTIRGEPAENVQRWKDMLNSDWEVTVWDNARVQKHFPDLYYYTLRQVLRNISSAAWAADIVRVAVIAKYGGVYLDTDILPLQPIPDWLLQREFALCNSFHSAWDFFNADTLSCVQTGNGAIGAFPGSKAFRGLLNTIVNTTHRLLSDPQKIADGELRSAGAHTGPMAYHYFDVKERFWEIAPITHLPAVVFGPCGHGTGKGKCRNMTFWSREEPRAIGLHDWDFSWDPGKQPKDMSSCPAHLRLQDATVDDGRLPIPPKKGSEHPWGDLLEIPTEDVAQIAARAAEVPPEMNVMVPQTTSVTPQCTLIPKKLHFIWVDERCPSISQAAQPTSSESPDCSGDPARVDEFLRSVRAWRNKLGESWEVFVWDRSRMEKEFPRVYAEVLSKMLDFATYPSQPDFTWKEDQQRFEEQRYSDEERRQLVQDIARVSVLQKLGGVYLDGSVMPAGGREKDDALPWWLLTQEFVSVPPFRVWGVTSPQQMDARGRRVPPYMPDNQAYPAMGAFPNSAVFSLCMEENECPRDNTSSRGYRNLFLKRALIGPAYRMLGLSDGDVEKNAIGLENPTPAQLARLPYRPYFLRALRFNHGPEFDAPLTVVPLYVFVPCISTTKSNSIPVLDKHPPVCSRSPTATAAKPQLPSGSVSVVDGEAVGSVAPEEEGKLNDEYFDSTEFRQRFPYAVGRLREASPWAGTCIEGSGLDLKCRSRVRQPVFLALG